MSLRAIDAGELEPPTNSPSSAATGLAVAPVDLEQVLDFAPAIEEQSQPSNNRAGRR
jgi:hypothetical protein